MESNNKYIVILAAYYPSYFNKAITELTKIFGSDMTLVVVDNGGKIKSNEFVHFLKGSNEAGEFSAWDEGYQYAVENFKIESKTFIFCNDTFCNHRFFTAVDRYLYRKKFSLVSHSEKRIVGEINTIKQDFLISNMKMNCWISSYIFALNSSDIKTLTPFNKCNDRNKCYVNFEKREIHVNYFSDNINAHLTNWLFPPSKNIGWYGANTGNEFKINFKLNAIINEKLLSYSSIKNNIMMCDIYQGFIFKYYNSIRNKLYMKLSILAKRS